MNIIVDKLTDRTLLRAACDSTRHPGQTPSTATLEKMYRCRHSPIRTQIFYIQLIGIPTFVSVHLVRHKHGVEHFVESNRDDRMEDCDGSSLTYSGFSQDFFLDTFEYRDGELFWKRRLTPMSKYKVGDLAGASGGRDGRVIIGVGKKQLYRSVVTYVMFAGYKPPVVDHVDGDPTNDRVENLRPATFRQNMQNNHRRRHYNKTGYKGVKQERSGNYVARIHHDGNELYLGTFTAAEDAALAYDAAAIKYFNEFAVLNFPDKSRPITRQELVNHSMVANAEALISMSRKRLCYASHKTTVGIFSRLRNAIRPVDPDLADNLYPECVACGYCPELKPCTAGPLAVIRAYRDAWPVRERARLAEESSKREELIDE